uniref:Uncharacterized protein n=1 Tax=Amphimedon queenslandica TaxID=400682 RepID=A0A1X7ST30_AMPQE
MPDITISTPTLTRLFNVRKKGGIIPTVLVQRGGGVVRNLKKTRNTREGLPLSLLHVKCRIYTSLSEGGYVIDKLQMLRVTGYTRGC